MPDIVDLMLRVTPMCEFSERALGRELVIIGQAAFDCEKTDERLDRLLHVGQRSGVRPYSQPMHQSGFRRAPAGLLTTEGQMFDDLGAMSLDLNTLLRDWPHEPGAIKVRKIAGLDGREKLQLRIDLGVLQMEMTGRPDGARPHGFESLLAYHQDRAGRAARTAQEYELSAEQCTELQQEGIQYYHRYLSLFQINDFAGVVRDTQRNLDLFDFVIAHSDREELAWGLQQFRPYVLMMNTRAKASALLGAGKFPEAMREIERGRDAIVEFFQRSNFPELAAKSSEIAFLEEWLEEVRAKRPLSKLEIMQREMETAIASELYERAAEIRDAIRMLKTQKSA